MKTRVVIGLAPMLVVLSGCVAQPGSSEESAEPFGSPGEGPIGQTQQALGENWVNGGNSLGGVGRLGTNDFQALEIEVNNTRALRIEPKNVCWSDGSTGECPNVIAGYSGNTGGSRGATIAGGGAAFGTAIFPNTVSGDYGTVSGGFGNVAGLQSNVGGGRANQALNHSTVAGGDGNVVLGPFGAIGGGSSNDIGASTSYGTIAGGKDNTVAHFVGTIGGGELNTVEGRGGTIAGGLQNWVRSTGESGTIAGGTLNDVQGQYGAVGGGYGNSASGTHGSVPGGKWNWAGGAYSFAAGRRAKADQNGCFTWADSVDVDLWCGAPDRFITRASGGYYLFTNSAAPYHYAYLTDSSAGWQYVSDRNAKKDVVPVSGSDVLEKLSKVGVSTWTFKSDAKQTRHMGPMAQDFHAAFKLGESDRSIDTADIIGVSFASIQALNEKLERENSDLRARVKRLEEGFSRLMAARSQPANKYVESR